MTAGGDGAARINLSGRGPQLALPPLPFSVGPSLRAQLYNQENGQCWEATYSEVEARGTERLTAVSD